MCNGLWATLFVVLKRRDRFDTARLLCVWLAWRSLKHRWPVVVNIERLPKQQLFSIAFTCDRVWSNGSLADRDMDFFESRLQLSERYQSFFLIQYFVPSWNVIIYSLLFYFLLFLILYILHIFIKLSRSTAEWFVSSRVFREFIFNNSIFWSL